MRNPANRPFCLRLGPLLTRRVKSAAAKYTDNNASHILRRAALMATVPTVNPSAYDASPAIAALVEDRSKFIDMESRIHMMASILKLTPAGESPELVKAIIKELHGIRAAQHAEGGLHMNLPDAFEELLELEGEV